MSNEVKEENELLCLTISDNIRIFDSKEYSGNNEIIEVVVPDSVTEIGDGVFRECHSIKKVTLSKNLKIINKNAFRRCKDLRKIEIPEGVERIEDYAFFGCEKLSKIVIPSSIKFIGKFAFHSCPNLYSLDIHSDADVVGLIDSIDTNNIIELIVSGNIIEENQFAKFNHLERLILSNGVTTVKKNAFGEQPELKEFHIPKTIKVYDSAMHNSTGGSHYHYLDCYFHGTVYEWINFQPSHNIVDYFTLKELYILEDDMWVNPTKVIIPD